MNVFEFLLALAEIMREDTGSFIVGLTMLLWLLAVVIVVAAGLLRIFSFVTGSVWLARLKPRDK